MTARVSGIVTTHRQPQLLAEALTSLGNETYGDVECVVVEDGSTLDQSAIDALYRGARLIGGDDVGIAEARNLGLAAACGEFVIFLDDDDVALPHRIATLMAVQRQTAADVCYGLTRRVVVESGALLDDVPMYPLASGPVEFLDLLINTPHVNAVLARTAALRDIGGFDAGADHFDDWSAWLRLADRGAKIHCVREVVAEWRQHDLGLTGRLSRAAAMKARILALFQRLTDGLTAENAEAVMLALRAVQQSPVQTYDDYVNLFRGVDAGHRGFAAPEREINMLELTPYNS